MKYIIKVKSIYILEFHKNLWSKFTPFLDEAQRFDTLEEAEEAKMKLLDPMMWRNFKAKDIEIIEVKE